MLFQRNQPKKDLKCTNGWKYSSSSLPRDMSKNLTWKCTALTCWLLDQYQELTKTESKVALRGGYCLWTCSGLWPTSVFLALLDHLPQVFTASKVKTYWSYWLWVTFFFLNNWCHWLLYWRDVTEVMTFTYAKLSDIVAIKRIPRHTAVTC